MPFKIPKKNYKKPKQTSYIEKADNKDLELTTEDLKSVLAGSNDVIFRELYINGNRDLPVTLLYVDGLVDSTAVSEDVLKPLAQEVKLSVASSINEIIELIEHGTIYFNAQQTRHEINEVINDVLIGSTALIFDKQKIAVTFLTLGFRDRAITEPTGENVIKGAKDAFIETLRVNTATLRRKIKTQNLVIEETKVGKQTLTPVAVTYIKGIANEKLVAEVKERLNEINIEGVVTTGAIEEFLVDNKYSLFPQISTTERPDKFAAKILEGRVGIMVDGIPISFIVPGTLNQFMHAPEDYAQNYIFSSLIRFGRFILVMVTLFLPAFYVAVTTFHHEMIPTELALAIEASKEGVPFPSFVEVILMLVAFEILLEAGVRLPKTIGQAVSIVGALVVGQAAVDAKLVSPAIVVVIATTGIAGFTIPNQDFGNAIRVWRIFMVILSSILGLVGLSFGFIILLYELARMESFGVPYLSPFVANEYQEFKDSFIRAPIMSNLKRPSSLKSTNKQRRK